MHPFFRFSRCVRFALLAGVSATLGFAAEKTTKTKAPSKPDDLVAQVGDGYRGIWYMNQPLKSEHATNTAAASPPTRSGTCRSRFPRRGAEKDVLRLRRLGGQYLRSKDELQHLVSYYDHATGTVPRPVRIVQKRTEDAHDNPTLSIDADGHLYVFSSAHGTSPPVLPPQIEAPYDITEWELIVTELLLHPAVVPAGVAALPLPPHALREGRAHTQLEDLADGRTWTAPQLFAHIEMGDYQLSARQGSTDRVAIAFDLHPNQGREGKGLNYRTNSTTPRRATPAPPGPTPPASASPRR
jgi:hypothetical protein